jgi:hypothetical protein
MSFSSSCACVLRLAAASALVALVAGCSHPITMITETAPPRSTAHLIPKKVAYVMTDAQRDLQVTTAGGSGDRVSYYPYRDLEKSIRDALRGVYRNVIVLRTASDAKANEAAGVSLVFTPQIKTDSSSSSWITWPPTAFTAEVSCVVTNAAGRRSHARARCRQRRGGVRGVQWRLRAGRRRAARQMTSQLSSEIRRNEKLQ